MKSDTFWLIIKGVGLIGGAMAAQYVSAISQWENDGTWPSTLNWHTIIIGTLGVGCSAMVAFTSGSVSEWRQKRNGIKTLAPTIAPETPPPTD